MSASNARALAVARPSRSPFPSKIAAAFLGAAPERFFAFHASHCGDPFIVGLPGIGDVVVSGSPEAARELFSAPPSTFVPLPNNPIEPLLGPRSMILLAGDAHRTARKLAMPPFHGERMRAYGTTMCERTQREIAAWRDGDAVDISAAMRRISLDIILRTVVGVDERSDAKAIGVAIAAMLDAYGTPLLVMPALRRPFLGLSPWARFARARDRACGLLANVIAARRASGSNGEDILGLLLAARDDEGRGLDDSELLDELRTLIVAGHDTTATALAWALHYIHADAELLATLDAEIAVCGPNPPPEALAELPWLGAVCSEALRLHPVVPIVPRRLAEPFVFRGVALPPGANIALALTLLHHDATTYQAPERFEPRRFIERKYGPFEYAPFGGGARRCIGAAFGVFEMKMVLGSILAAGRLRRIAARAPARILAGITMGPRRKVRLRVTPRH